MEYIQIHLLMRLDVMKGRHCPSPSFSMLLPIVDVVASLWKLVATWQVPLRA
jgi:hypothetical protein